MVRTGWIPQMLVFIPCLFNVVHAASDSVSCNYNIGNINMPKHVHPFISVQYCNMRYKITLVPANKNNKWFAFKIFYNQYSADTTCWLWVSTRLWISSANLIPAKMLTVNPSSFHFHMYTGLTNNIKIVKR